MELYRHTTAWLKSGTYFGTIPRLYARMVQTPGTFARVAVVNQQVVGFVAGTENTRTLYRAFIVRDGIIAGILALPQILLGQCRSPGV